MRVGIGMIIMFLGMAMTDSQSLIPTMLLMSMGALILLPAIKEEK